VLAAPPAERLAAARHAMERHPADHVLAGRAAEALLHQGDRRALDVIARALARSSQHAGLRRLAGRILSRTDHPAQAAVEFAAASNLVVNARPIVDDVLVVFRTPEAIAAALSTEPRQAWHITAHLHERKRDDAALVYATTVAERHPHSVDAQANLADIALKIKASEVAAEAAAAAYRLLPTARHASLLGQALLQLGEHERGIASVTAALERPTADGPIERVRLLTVLTELQAAHGELARAKTTLERARELARDDRGWQVFIHERMARLEDALGNPQQAAWERGEAARLSRDLQ
jgi:tetratricopeptide (TPR) repeat protein